MTQTPQDDPTLDLLQRWRQGDRAALNALLANVLPWLRDQVRQPGVPQLRHGDESMDIVQTAVLNFLTWGPPFAPENGTHFRALLKRIAINDLIDRSRHDMCVGGMRHLDSLFNSANPLSGFAARSASSLRPSHAAEQTEDGKWVRLALEYLSADDRYLILASEVEGIDWATIAEKLELASADTARMRCARLKPKLANLMRRLHAGKLPELE